MLIDAIQITVPLESFELHKILFLTAGFSMQAHSFCFKCATKNL